MSCLEIRDRLMAAERGEWPAAVGAHLEGCSTCAAFARRLELAHAALREHQAEHLPDPYFASRVSSLSAARGDELAWAARRLLPVTLALALALGAWCWLATPAPTELVELAPTEDLLTWALEGNGS